MRSAPSHHRTEPFVHAAMEAMTALGEGGRSRTERALAIDFLVIVTR